MISDSILQWNFSTWRFRANESAWIAYMNVSFTKFTDVPNYELTNLKRHERGRANIDASGAPPILTTRTCIFFMASSTRD